MRPARKRRRGEWQARVDLESCDSPPLNPGSGANPPANEDIRNEDADDCRPAARALGVGGQGARRAPRHRPGTVREDQHQNEKSRHDRWHTQGHRRLGGRQCSQRRHQHGQRRRQHGQRRRQHGQRRRQHGQRKCGVEQRGRDQSLFPEWSTPGHGKPRCVDVVSQPGRILGPGGVFRQRPAAGGALVRPLGRCRPTGRACRSRRRVRSISAPATAATSRVTTASQQAARGLHRSRRGADQCRWSAGRRRRSSGQSARCWRPGQQPQPEQPQPEQPQPEQPEQPEQSEQSQQPRWRERRHGQSSQQQAPTWAGPAGWRRRRRSPRGRWQPGSAVPG